MAVDAVRAAAVRARLRGHRGERHAGGAPHAGATPTATSSCAAAAARPTTRPRPWPTRCSGSAAAGLPERLVVDASHDNSGKDHRRQPRGGVRPGAAGGRRQRRDRGRDARVVPRGGPPGAAAGRREPHLRAVDHRRRACPGTRRWARSTSWPPRCARGARGPDGHAHRDPRRRADRRLHRPGGEGARPSDAEVVGFGRSPERLERARELGAIDRGGRLARGGARGRRGLLCLRAGGRAARAGGGRPRGGAASLRGQRRRLDQAPAGRGRAATSASSAATRWPARRPRGSSTRAPTCSRAPSGTSRPTERSSGLLYERLHRLIVSFGARPVAIDAETHDRLLATVSHLPHVLANVLVSQAARVLAREDEPLPRVGPSFRDATRVAGASSGIWTDIYLANREAIAAELDETAASLGEVAAALRAGDPRRDRRVERRRPRGPQAPARGRPGRRHRSRAAPDRAEPPGYRRAGGARAGQGRREHRGHGAGACSRHALRGDDAVDRRRRAGGARARS